MPSPAPSVAANPVLSVSTLNRLVRDCLEAAFPLTWVGGEISNLTYAASGHVYFSLKDAGAQVRCVMWRNRAQLLGWRLENGQQIEARVLVSFYEQRGEFQLTVEDIRHAGQGDLFERFLRLKAQLEGEGLFAAELQAPAARAPARAGHRHHPAGRGAARRAGDAAAARAAGQDRHLPDAGAGRRRRRADRRSARRSRAPATATSSSSAAAAAASRISGPSTRKSSPARFAPAACR